MINYGIEHQYYISRYGKAKKLTQKEFDALYEDCNPVNIHSEIANKEYPDVRYPDDFVIEVKGWIKIGSLVQGGAICEKMPTQSQLRALKELGYLRFRCNGVSYEIL